ncbi:MAG: V-type ATP synthase subunit D [Candidatus Aenigmarchaeota archaeon]|nr:V-type ATP synthase subunit D [Candidatus Aenigmarchaeota archaeon]
MPEVKPTRSELISLKRKIKLAQSGHRLLKKKRDGLVIEFFAVLKKARDQRKEMHEAYKAAEERMRQTAALEGFLAIKNAATLIAEQPALAMQVRNIMGVTVPKIDPLHVRKVFAERAPMSLSLRVEGVAESYAALVEIVVNTAETETALRKILREIERTKRRVNALEFVVIPRLRSQAAFVSMRLEEMERESTFRMKRIKDAAAAPK